MFIAVGTWERTQARGWAAGICPRCRDVTSCGAEHELEIVVLYWFLPVCFRTVGRYLVCESCKARFPYDKAEIRPSRRPGLSIDELIFITHPQARERLASIQSRSDRLESGRLSDEDRAEMAAEAFLQVDHLIRRRQGATRIDGVAALWFLGAVIGTIVGTSAMSFMTAKPAQIVTVVAMVVLWIATIGILAVEPQRYLRKKLLPQLAPELLPLELDSRHLRAARRRLKRLKTGIWKAMRPAQIVLELERLRPAVPS